MTNSYTELLSLAADEVRAFVEKKASLSPAACLWAGLANAMEAAAQVSDEAAEGAIRAIARNIIDEFPIGQDFAPSFTKALGTLHMKQRQLRRTTG